MTWPAIFVGVCLATSQLPPCQVAAAGDLASFFPRAVSGTLWHPSDSLRIVEGTELYLLIDGGADIYLEYGFRRAGARHYSDTSGAEISLEIYEMDNAEAAYGVFSFLAAGTGARVACGQEGTAGEDFLIFWKNRFVVSVTALEEGARNGIRPLGAIVDQNMPAGGRRPELAELLMRPELPNSEVIWIKGPLAFLRRANFAQTDLFHLREGSSGFVDGCCTFILRYRSEEECDSAAAGGVVALSRTAGYKEVSKDKRSWLLANRRGKGIWIDKEKALLLITTGDAIERVGKVGGLLRKTVLVEYGRTHE